MHTFPRADNRSSSGMMQWKRKHAHYSCGAALPYTGYAITHYYQMTSQNISKVHPKPLVQKQTALFILLNVKGRMKDKCSASLSDTNMCVYMQ